MSLSLKAARAGASNRRAMPGQYGDPGLFGFLGKVAKGALGVATGGLSTVAIDAVSGLIGGGGSRPAMPGTGVMAPPPRIIGPDIGIGGGRRMTFGPAIVSPGTAVGPAMSGTKLACPSGYHPNKSAYFLKNGTFVPEGSRCVKNRRRDPLNPRALSRAISRIDAGKAWQSKMREIETGKHTKAGARK